MKNLAGARDADNFIRLELETAQIPKLNAPKDMHSEVPYTIKGSLGDWSFERTLCYTVAKVPTHSLGIPLDNAAALNEKKYPLKDGERGPKTYGEVVRVNGYAGGDDPRNWAFPSEEALKRDAERLGVSLERLTNGELAKLCNDGKITSPRFVDTYHVDTQEGLNELARTIKNLSK